MMVIMKVRPARELNEAKLDECLQRIGLTFVATLEPGRWDLDERMIATRTLDPADKAAGRTDWQDMRQLRRIQVATDMKTAEKGAKKRYKADKSFVNVVEWEGAFGPDAPQARGLSSSSCPGRRRTSRSRRPTTPRGWRCSPTIGETPPSTNWCQQWRRRCRHNGTPARRGHQSSMLRTKRPPLVGKCLPRLGPT